MVEECIHICASGSRCRRIPKRGDKFCPAHRAPRRRRALMEEDPAFLEQIYAYCDHLKAIPLEDLLYATVAALADIHELIDRKSSRRHRAAFLRATSAAGEAADRVTLIMRGYQNDPRTSSPASALPASPQPLTPEQRASLALATQSLSRPLSPEELDNVIHQILSTLEPNMTTNPTADTYR